MYVESAREGGTVRSNGSEWSRSNRIKPGGLLQFRRIAVLIVCAAAAVTPQNNVPRRSYGLRLMDQAQYNSIPLALVPLSGVLPPAMNLSADFPPVRDQGTQQSCVGWSVGYGLRTYLERRERRWDVSAPAYQ